MCHKWSRKWKQIRTVWVPSSCFVWIFQWDVIHKSMSSSDLLFWNFLELCRNIHIWPANCVFALVNTQTNNGRPLALVQAFSHEHDCRATCRPGSRSGSRPARTSARTHGSARVSAMIVPLVLTMTLETILSLMPCFLISYFRRLCSRLIDWSATPGKLPWIVIVWKAYFCNINNAF